MARLLEKQSHYRDALEIYQALAAENQADPEIQAAVARVQGLVDSKPDDGRDKGARIAVLCEKWIRLIILKHRFHNFLAIRSRL